MSASNHPARRGSSAEPGNEHSKSALEKELAEKEASIHHRLDELESEIASAPAAIKSSIVKHPLLGLAGAAASGVAVGLIVTGLRRKKPDAAPFHQRLVEQYIDAVGEDVRRRMRRGRSIEEAVRDALRGRAPLVVYAPTRTVARESKGFFSEFADILLKTALGFAVKVAIDVASASVDVDELQAMITREEEQEGGGGAASHAGDGATGPVDQAADMP